MLTSLCCKTMEHIIPHHIMEHLQRNRILKINNMASDMVFLVSPSWLPWWKICYTTWIITIKSTSSFLILHNCLIVSHNNIFYLNPPAMVLLEMFSKVWLMCRSQQVMLDGVSSSPVLDKSRVLQGDVLGLSCS